jgi:hypothetical protein
MALQAGLSQLDFSPLAGRGKRAYIAGIPRGNEPRICGAGRYHRKRRAPERRKMKAQGYVSKDSVHALLAHLKTQDFKVGISHGR